MKCPVCGCKMKKEIVCPYCKITGDEVRFASNVEAKKRIKQKDPKDVHVSTYIPYDVNKKKLLLVTLLGGFFGADAYYLGRYKRALIQSAIIVLAFMVFLMYQYMGLTFMEWPTEMFTLVCAVFVLIWISNIFNVIFLNKASVPVVLPTKEELLERIQTKQEEDKRKQEEKQARAQKKYDKMVEREKKKQEKEQENKKDKE